MPYARYVPDNHFTRTDSEGSTLEMKMHGSNSSSTMTRYETMSDNRITDKSTFIGTKETK